MVKNNTATAKVKTPKLETVSPMYSWTNAFRELFKRDPEIKMSFNEDTLTIDMEVDNQIKALAISKLVPNKKVFSEGTVTINVKIAPHFGGDKYLPDVVYEAFKGNPLFDYMYWWADPDATSNPMCWVCMTPEAIFYPESNLHHIYGDTVKFAEEIATNILTDQTDCIFYCTDNPEREAPDHNTQFFN